MLLLQVVEVLVIHRLGRGHGSPFPLVGTTVPPVFHGVVTSTVI